MTAQCGCLDGEINLRMRASVLLKQCLLRIAFGKERNPSSIVARVSRLEGCCFLWIYFTVIIVTSTSTSTSTSSTNKLRAPVELAADISGNSSSHPCRSLIEAYHSQ